RAAGELRLRIREKVLRALSEPAIDEKRRKLLHEALAGVDTASIGTIHSFADRLLRQRPREARLSPAYEIYEDTGALILETFTVLLHASQTGTLKAELEATEAAARAAEAEQTIRDAISAGVRVDSLELEWGRLGGLDALVEGFVTRRDVPPADPVPEEFDFAEFRGYAMELVALVTSMKGTSRGAEWLHRTARLVEGLSRSDDPIAIYREVLAGRVKPPDYKKGAHFEGEKDAWAVWKTFTEGKDRGDALWDDPVAPLHRWMTKRLVRLFPVVTALYGKVKGRHHAVDQVDLLLEFKDLLARDKAVRGEYQGLFDHIFVDEFQDTDPLQAEIIVFLCERKAQADRLQDVELSDGKLTLVGDPKQSIYRFRRADIGMYDRVRSLVASRPHLEVTLSANFRSRPSLIGWFNERFDRLLGKAESGKAIFRPETGEVLNQGLVPGKGGGNGPCVDSPTVHVLPFELAAGKGKVGEYRVLEAKAMAHYLR
ncbi:MAG: UvrD-helicase domain-containing protein, partial [Rubrobacteraceae bacterium]